MKKIRGISLKLLSSVVLVLSLASCESVQTTQGGTVGVDRKQMMVISSQEITQAAQKEYSQLVAEQSRKGALNRNQAQYNRVRAIAARLIQQTPVFRSDAANWTWEVNVFSSPEVNAWCMPGGKIAVYTGLLDKIQPTDDELAEVIGHEMAHALREHARERASEQAVAGAGISILAAAAGLGDLGQKGMEYAYMGLLGLPNSRRHETEADRIGIEMAARAGYNPQAAISLWQKMARAGGDAPIKFLSTHPSHAERQADLTDYAQRVMPLYEQARKKH